MKLEGIQQPKAKANPLVSVLLVAKCGGTLSRSRDLQTLFYFRQGGRLFFPGKQTLRDDCCARIPWGGGGVFLAPIRSMDKE